MSGIEIVGLILGVMGVAGPLKSVTKTILRVGKPSESFRYFLRDISSRTLRYEKRYLGICSALVRPMSGLSESDIESMFGRRGEQHPNWWRAEFLDKLETYLQPDNSGILDAMVAVQREMFRLYKAIEKIPQLCVAPDSDCQTLTTRDKIKISPKAKDKIEGILRKYKERLDDFKDVVDAFTANKMKDVIHCRQQALRELDLEIQKGVSNQQWAAILKLISISQSSSQHLFESLTRSFSCRCHDLKLKINFDLMQMLPPSKPEGTPPRLNFLVTMPRGTASGDDEFMIGIARPVLDVRASPIRLQELEIASRPMSRPFKADKTHRPPIQDAMSSLVMAPLCSSLGASHLSASYSTTTTTSHTPQTTLTVTAQSGSVGSITLSNSPIPPPPSSSLLKHKISRVSSRISGSMRLKRQKLPEPPCAPKASPGSANDTIGLSDDSDCSVEDGAGESSAEIADLCTVFSKFGAQGNSSASLGRLQDRNAFQHWLSGKGDLTGTETTISLRDVLSNNNEFYAEDKLHVAYHMASSLLQLHLPTWAAHGWRSTDVWLLHDTSAFAKEDWIVCSQDFHTLRQRTLEVQDLPLAIPVAAGFSQIRKLGVVLLEIGQGQALPAGLATEGEVEEACKLLRKSRVRKVMGRKYWAVAEVCLDWRNRTGLSEDLTLQDVQRAFFDEVVSKLKIMIDTF